MWMYIQKRWEYMYNQEFQDEVILKCLKMKIYSTNIWLEIIFECIYVETVFLNHII